MKFTCKVYFTCRNEKEMMSSKKLDSTVKQKYLTVL